MVQETELGRSNQEVSLPAAKNTEVVLKHMEMCAYSYIRCVNIPEVRGCYLL